MVRWSGITILFVAVTLAALLLPGTATAGYVVNPMTTEYTSEVKDVEENTFQDLPLRVMLLYCMLVVLPACFYPGELFYLLSILLPFGFRRVMRHNVLDDDFRRDLYRRITDRPGTSTRELGELTGASRGRLRYHLDILIREGKVATVDYRSRARHFARNQRYTELEEHILISLREEPCQTILWRLLGSSDMTRSELEEHLGLSGPTISQHMQEFEAEGVIAAERGGRFVRYRLSKDAREILNRYTGDNPVSRHPGTEGYPAAQGHEVSQIGSR